MGVLKPEPPTPTRSKRTSTAPRSSAPSLPPPSDHSSEIAALTAKLDELREAGETDRATIQALRDDLAALKMANHVPPVIKPEGNNTLRSWLES